MTILVALLAITSFARCQVWRTKTSLWSDCVSKSELNPRAHSNLAIAMAQEGMYKPAISSFERALDLLRKQELELDYKDMVAMNDLTQRLGTVCWLDGQYQKAEKYYRLWLQQDDQPFHLYLDVANRFAQANRYDDAIEFYQKALVTALRDEEKAFVLVEQGFEALQSNQPENGRRLLQTAVSLDPESWKAHNNLGIAIMSTDQDSKLAKNHFQRAVELSGGHPEAVANLQRVEAVLQQQ